MFTRSKNIIFTLILAIVLASCSFGNIVVNCTSFTMTFTINEEDIEDIDENDLLDLLEDRTPMIDAYDGEGNLIFDITASSGPEDAGATFEIIEIDESTIQFIMTIPYTSPPQGNPITARFYLMADGENPEIVLAQGVGECNYDNPGPAPVRTFMDGRINYRDAAAPFAAYGVSGNLHIYWITGDNDTGKLELIVTEEELADVPEFPESNTLVKANEALGIYVYRLTDGKWQVQARMPNGKLYVLIFEDFHNRDYQSMEIE